MTRKIITIMVFAMLGLGGQTYAQVNDNLNQQVEMNVLLNGLTQATHIDAVLTFPDQDFRDSYTVNNQGAEAWQHQITLIENGTEFHFEAGNYNQIGDFIFTLVSDDGDVRFGMLGCNTFYTCQCGPITPDTLCGLDGNGFISTCAGGGTPPYTRTWYDSSGTIIAGPSQVDLWDIDNLNAGTYTQVVTDADDCVVELDYIVPDEAVNCCDDMLVIVDWLSVSCPAYSAYLELNGDYGTITWTITGPGLNLTQTSDDVTVIFPQIGGIYMVTATSSLGCSITTAPWNIPSCVVTDPCDDMLVVVDWLSVDCPTYSVFLELNGDYGDVTWDITGPGLNLTQTSDDVTVNIPLGGGTYSGTATTTLGCVRSFGPWFVPDCTPVDSCEDYNITNGVTEFPDTLYADICDTDSFNLYLTTESGIDLNWFGDVNGQLMAEFGTPNLTLQLGIGIHTIIGGDCFGDCRDTLVIVLTEVDCGAPEICGRCVADSVTYQQALPLSTIYHNEPGEFICPGESLEISNCMDLGDYDLGGIAITWVVTYLSDQNGTQIDSVIANWFDFDVYFPGRYQVDAYHLGGLLDTEWHEVYSDPGCAGDWLTGGGDASFSITSSGGTTAVKEVIESDVTITVGPNPTTGHLFIQSSVPVHRYQIFNEVGQLVESASLMQSSITFSIQVTEPNGMYFVVLSTEQGIRLPTQKVVKIE